MYEDLVGKKEEEEVEVTKNGERNIFACNPNNHITFFNNEKIVGMLQWYGNSLKFEGNAEESAKLFFDYLGKNIFDIGNEIALEEAREEIEDLKKKLDCKYDIEIGDCYINNHEGTYNQDHVNKTISITKGVILPRTFEFYDPIDENDLVTIPRKKLMELMEGKPLTNEAAELLIEAKEEIEKIENELIYYRNLCENLQKTINWN